MYDILKYTDETDKSLGVAGMAIALLACDGENFISSVSIEEDEDTLMFAPDAFFMGNPRFSAKVAWNQLLREYHVFSGMLIGNILCRHIVPDRSVRSELISLLRSLVAEHGTSVCELEDDEIDSFFSRDMNYFSELFSHPTVIDVAGRFATTLRMQRRMTAGDIFENLSRLSSL